MFSRHRNLDVSTNKWKASGNIVYLGIIEKYIGRTEDADLFWYVIGPNNSKNQNYYYY